MKILILGGYGVFGGRLAELLSDISTIELLICGRNLARAEAFSATLAGQATLRPMCLDRKDIAQALHAENPGLVIDASGPFQNYGDNGYHVVQACIASGVNYMDFADAAGFVFGISKFNDAAKSAKVFVLSGVSSFPVLTAAVLREMAKAPRQPGWHKAVASRLLSLGICRSETSIFHWSMSLIYWLFHQSTKPCAISGWAQAQCQRSYIKS
ncbi:MAG: saccharopine dehydrogenase NADP-binding domain-containing protein [Paracoccaceae bacterium]